MIEYQVNNEKKHAVRRALIVSFTERVLVSQQRHMIADEEEYHCHRQTTLIMPGNETGRYETHCMSSLGTPDASHGLVEKEMQFNLS
jgi:hypothetical protein